MDPRLVHFVENSAQSVVGVDVALFFQANPKTFDTAAGLALRTHRSIDEVEAVLERLTADGVLESFSRGEGHYTCYSLPSDPHVWNLLCMLSEAYLDHLEDRKQIIKILISKQQARHGNAVDSAVAPETQLHLDGTPKQE